MATPNYGFEKRQKELAKKKKKEEKLKMKSERKAGDPIEPLEGEEVDSEQTGEQSTPNPSGTTPSPT